MCWRGLWGRSGLLNEKTGEGDGDTIHMQQAAGSQPSTVLCMLCRVRFYGCPCCVAQGSTV